jgi:branched-chain amino acid transport system ATP-binding protein
MSQPLLSVSGLMMRFGGLLAVNNVSLELREREIVSLIGPNGAGKTTVFNCLTGFYKPTGGTILLRDQHLEGLPGQQIARMGVVRTFQHVRLFREMTVIENLLVAQHQQLKTGLFSGLLKTPAFRRAQSEALDAPPPGWSVSACWSTPTVRPATWPTATSAGWRLPAAW